MKHDWIDILRTKMQTHEMEPLPIDWSKVDDLAEKKAANGKHGGWEWRRLTAAAVLLLLVGWGAMRYPASWLGQDGPDGAVPEAKRLAAVDDKPAREKPSAVRNRALMGNDETEEHVASSESDVASEETMPASASSDDGIMPAEEVKEPALGVPKHSDNQRLSEENSPSRSAVRPNLPKTNSGSLLLAEARMRRSHRKASLLLAASPNMGNKLATMGGLSVAGLYGDAPANMSSAAPLLAGKETVPQSTVNHHQPLRFTLACAYPLGSRLSLVGGICYSYLYSELGSQSSGYSSSGSQELHFLGIPLSLRCRLFSIGDFGMYLSAGGMMEKMMGGHLASTIHRGSQTERESSSVSVGSLFVSVHASMGVDYRLTGSVSLFGEAGVSHYFDPPTRVSSYYSDQPTSMQFQLGLRYDLP